ncbi:four helix bundle protein [Algoriphagus antarcticus]|uniref:Four helix bundle protein n=1 Tax=Algoriphagus antarcticus TaxID=238540 RepID=A0A3E0D4Q5_9BACT|nr:four helix bundle protein [Algoriphagus antarcticus]REG77497.1 four helix bundle protein [Algoriphagus antarcticus]
MASITSFENLEIWKLARELCLYVRVLSRKELFSKDFRFCGQINSAAGSIMDNIAEGFERYGNKEFINFLYIAKGSNGEVRSQSFRALDANFINNFEHSEIQRLT